MPHSELRVIAPGVLTTSEIAEIKAAALLANPRNAVARHFRIQRALHLATAQRASSGKPPRIHAPAATNQCLASECGTSISEKSPPVVAADTRHVRIREITAEINRLATELTSLT